MLIRLLVPRVNAEGELDPPGKILDLPDVAATALVSRGIATTEIDPPAPAPAPPPAPPKMVKIRLIAETLIDSRVCSAGQIVDVPQSIALALVQDGVAAPATEAPKPAPAPAPNGGRGGK